MKRAAIITITDYVNYGNRLQNYAAQELLKSYGLEVESIANFPVKDIQETGIRFTFGRIRSAMKLSPVSLIKKVFDKISEKKNREIYRNAQQAKERSFRAYALKHTCETKFVVRDNFVPNDLGDQYDYFVIGSDQIWNPNIRYGNSFDFAQFAPRAKRIALAPSFGVSSIDERYKEHYSKWLSEIDYLSVREQAGASLIKMLSGKDAQVLVDPTLMLNREQWLAVSENAAKKPSKAYLLTYFIGAVSKKRNKIITELAQKYELEIVRMASLDDPERYDANPGEFIDYINSAQIICTDSFHAIIFSMQMEKPFVVFDREGKSSPMSSRIDTLLKKFGFEHRKYHTVKANDSFSYIDYSHFETVLLEERNKVHAFLRYALKS